MVMGKADLLQSGIPKTVVEKIIRKEGKQMFERLIL